MKTCVKNLFLLPALMATLGLPMAGRATAQTFTTLHSFTAFPLNVHTNGDGVFPSAGLMLSGNTLYGTAGGGGSSEYGTVFKVNTDGTGFTVLHSFAGSDGGSPNELILSGNTLYGTTYFGGGVSGVGTVFKVNSDGTGLTTLHTFPSLNNNSINSDGALPYAG